MWDKNPLLVYAGTHDELLVTQTLLHSSRWAVQPLAVDTGMVPRTAGKSTGNTQPISFTSGTKPMRPVF